MINKRIVKENSKELNTIEVLLHTPPSVTDYHKKLEKFISYTLKQIVGKKLEVNIVDKLSDNTAIVISLISLTLGEYDETYYNKYQNKEFRFLLYYFQDLEINVEDIDKEVYERIRFKFKVDKDALTSCFGSIDDIKKSLTIKLKETMFDLEHNTNYSQINSAVLNKRRDLTFQDVSNNLRKVDVSLRKTKRALICGLEGTGKTTLAIEYAKDAMKYDIYDYVILLDIGSGIDVAIETFATQFLLSSIDEATQQFAQFIEKYPYSLVILDNYIHNMDNQKKLQSLLDKIASADIIVTSKEDMSDISDAKYIQLETTKSVVKQGINHDN
jgi:hypothetical protein